LGHAFWICTDVAACAGFLAATYHGLRWINRPTTGKSVAAAIAIALAISCKFSCVLVIPGLALAMIIRPLPILFDDDDQKWRNYFDSLPSMKQFAIMAVVGFVTLWATYLFNIGPLADQSAFNDQKEWQRLPAILKNTPIPMPSLPLGILRLLGHNRYGHSAYLNGQIRMHGWWYYFPEAIALKSPLALLVGIVIALILLFRLGKPRLWPAAGFILPPAIFLAAAMKGNLDIGIRHMLPIIPFLYLLVCTYLVRARWILWLMVLIGVCFMETAWVHPEYVSFFNLAAGGPSHGDRFLVDSNLDWGQDIALLSRWLHSDANKGISYSSRLFMYPVKPLDAALDIDPAAQTKPPIGIFIISQNVKTGATPTSTDNLEDRQSPGDFTWLEKFPIVKRIGYSILVYNVSEPSGPTATKIREDIRNTSQPQFSTGDTQDELRVK
ncbi:MAG TPA: hypothetical protein VKK61_01285, partial [Tepidisphaeraceae bacterium]|nr:hypothetical protein [Tepidisphaeraceae bacterium]